MLDVQARAVLREYREALEDEHFALANRIWNANPNLHKALVQVNDEFIEAREEEGLFFDYTFDEAWDALRRAAEEAR